MARSPDYYGCVREFHDKFGIPAPDRATVSIPGELKISRIELMREELAELIAAMESAGLVEIARGVELDDLDIEIGDGSGQAARDLFRLRQRHRALAGADA